MRSEPHNMIPADATVLCYYRPSIFDIKSLSSYEQSLCIPEEGLVGHATSVGVCKIPSIRLLNRVTA
jgi:hypothetical protein